MEALRSRPGTLQNVVERIVSCFEGIPGLLRKLDEEEDAEGENAGAEDAEGEDTPTGRYNREDNEIQIFSDYIPNKEEVLRNLVHEYTHYLQPDGLDTKYYNQGYTYQNNPAELEALRAEEKWHLFA